MLRDMCKGCSFYRSGYCSIHIDFVDEIKDCKRRKLEDYEDMYKGVCSELFKYDGEKVSAEENKLLSMKIELRDKIVSKINSILSELEGLTELSKQDFDTIDHILLKYSSIIEDM